MKYYFYPNKAIYHVANHVLGGLGHEIVFDPSEADAYFWWKFSAEWEDFPEELSDKPCLNRNCNCTLKTFVEDRFSLVYGRTTFVDPLTYNGLAVEKENLNATHKCRIVECPIKERVEGMVYQRLMSDPNNIVSYRIPVVGGEVPYVSIEHKNDMFEAVIGGGVDSFEVVDAEDLFCRDWLDKLVVFCNGYVDFAEIDVLDDCIIDVNNTASAAPHYEPKDEDYCKSRYRELFKKHFG